MSEKATTVGLDITAAIDGLEQAADSIVAAGYGRVFALSQIPEDIAGLRASFANAATSPFVLALEIILVIALVRAVFLLAAWWDAKISPKKNLWRTFFTRLVATIVALAVGFAAARLLAGTGLPLRTLRLWAIGTVASYLIVGLTGFILLASKRFAFRHRSYHLLALVRDLSVPITWAIFGLAFVETLQIWNGGSGLLDLTRTLLVAIPAYILFASAIWRNRRALASVVAGPRPRSQWRSHLARRWPAIIIGFLGITFISTQAALTLGAPLPGSAVVLTLLMLLLTPHLDAMILHWAQRKLEAPTVSIAAAAGRQTTRFAVLIVTLSLLGSLWATPLALALGFELRNVAREAFGMALIALAAAFLWNAVGTLTARALRRRRVTPGGGDEDGLDEPRSRLGTIVPLLSGVGKSSILAVVVLSILISLGVNVWPLITGLSVFGLAIGFGSQTLVKDVVSGLFFLIDDAFRFGEYIETSGAKGTVEKISIRSVSLRNSRGSIATVPYGQIGKIQNFSRDWVIEKLTFRVAFDTDVELVRKLFKKIGQDIAADPELSADLLEPFKSQGIGEVEDGTLIIKAKFTAKPGKQSMIRRAVLMAVQNAFRENGIHAVPKPISANAEPAA